MSILEELAELVSGAEATKKREESMIEMFRLAGYEINETDDEGKGRPKDLIELLKEALGNPPTEPGKWIRISDIPRYIVENLNVPEDLDEFNDRSRASKELLIFNSDDEEPSPLDDENYGKPIVPKGYRAVGELLKNTDGAQRGDMFADIRGDVWIKENDTQWSLLGDDDKGGYYEVDANNFPPLVKIAKGGPVRNRNPVL